MTMRIGQSLQILTFINSSGRQILTAMVSLIRRLWRAVRCSGGGEVTPGDREMQ